MDRKIAFFTEGGYGGKVPRNFENMRTDLAWVCALEAEHHPLRGFYVSDLKDKYDLGIVILPKKDIQHALKGVEFVKSYCKKIAFMQEGPNWYWQDYEIEDQINYYNFLVEADFILCHNQSDVRYYQGLTGKKAYKMPALMIEDAIPGLEHEERQGVMIGGNWCSWYGGFDSYVVAREIEEDIYCPSMGRMREEEKHTGVINYLPYVNWQEWIRELNKRKYAIHLMRTHAAGTFALNCAYLSIPCIGYYGLDAQERCHPDLTVEVGNVEKAVALAKQLKQDWDFYDWCAEVARDNYELFSERMFLNHMNYVFKEVLD